MWRKILEKSQRGSPYWAVAGKTGYFDPICKEPDVECVSPPFELLNAETAGIAKGDEGQFSLNSHHFLAGVSLSGMQPVV